MVPKTPSEAPLPASLLLRVAEAADGMRDGQPHWFLVDRSPPHTLAPYNSAADAEAALGKKKPAANFIVMGPYVAGAAAGARKGRKKKKKIKSIQIHYEGAKKPVELDPARVDAIFLSGAALDKFVYPYYARTRGVDAAAQLRVQQLGEDDDPPDPPVHTPWSDWG